MLICVILLCVVVTDFDALDDESFGSEVDGALEHATLGRLGDRVVAILDGIVELVGLGVEEALVDRLSDRNERLLDRVEHFYDRDLPHGCSLRLRYDNRSESSTQTN